MVGSMWSSDGSGAGKKSAGRRDERVMLNAMRSWSFQSLSDTGDRTTLSTTAEDVIRRENLERLGNSHPYAKSVNGTVESVSNRRPAPQRITTGYK